MSALLARSCLQPRSLVRLTARSLAAQPDLPKIAGGYKKGTDVPLLPQPSSDSFNSKVTSLKEALAAGNMEELKKVLTFAIFIFGMRHPKELRDLLDNLEAVDRAKAGADDGSIDPDESMSSEDKFEALKKSISEGDLASMQKTAIAAISLISIFHIDQLPLLMPIYATLKPVQPADTATFSAKMEVLQGQQLPMDVIKTVAIWAVSCFAKYHPDVVVMMKLVPEE
eukprot:TRINITY_DN67819_c0_g1_i1.p1 TRINITY_DN67819_c0_g1~~TRINITY_DN67819_c0_g1_i1.p1  ORF type:complete len:226 (+),score=59.10 TRINITY_DN67819_c0_g1_i1:106-783(+)